ncbi:hypothetical protein [Streptomyces sp. NPDC004285]
MPQADAAKAKAPRGAAVHDFRLWVPPTGRAVYVPVAFVFTGKTAAKWERRMRRLEQAAPVLRRHSVPGSGAAMTAEDYHEAVPVVVTELGRVAADPAGAAGEV